MRLPLRQWLQRQRQRIAAAWLERRVPPEAPRILLHRRRLFILPTRLGWVYAGIVITLLIGSVNYETNLGFAATFLLAGLGITGMIRTYRNLHGLILRFGPAQPVFAGGSAHFPVTLDGQRQPRRAIAVADAVEPRIDAGVALSTHVTRTTRTRGRLALPRLSVATSWPLGLFRVWSWVHPRVETVVYPRAVDHGHPPPDSHTRGSGATRTRAGEEELAGLREYTAGDSPRRIAWKSYARTGALHTKLFEAEAAGDRVFDWYELSRLEHEARLEQMAYWVVAAEARGERYALRLPDRVLAPDTGAEHRHSCLEALALHGEGRA